MQKVSPCRWRLRQLPACSIIFIGKPAQATAMAETPSNHFLHTPRAAVNDRALTMAADIQAGGRYGLFSKYAARRSITKHRPLCGATQSAELVIHCRRYRLRNTGSSPARLSVICWRRAVQHQHFPSLSQDRRHLFPASGAVVKFPPVTKTTCRLHCISSGYAQNSQACFYLPRRQTSYNQQPLTCWLAIA